MCVLCDSAITNDSAVIDHTVSQFPSRRLDNTSYAFSASLAAGADVASVHGLVRVQLVDRFGSAVATDSSSTCAISGVIEGTGAFVSFYYSTVYPVVAGVASIAPFRVDLPAGSVVIVTVSCGSAGLKLVGRVTIDAIQVQMVGQSTYEWLPSNGSVTLPLAPAPQARFLRATGEPVIVADVQCSVSVQSPLVGCALLAQPPGGYLASTATGLATLDRVQVCAWVTCICLCWS